MAIVGASFMGSGIAESVAAAGIDVALYELEAAPLTGSRERLKISVDRALARTHTPPETHGGLGPP